MFPPPKPPVDEPTRALLMTVRQALIMVIGGVEDYLGLERSIIPRRKRPPTDPHKGVKTRNTLD